MKVIGLMGKIFLVATLGLLCLQLQIYAPDEYCHNRYPYENYVRDSSGRLVSWDPRDNELKDTLWWGKDVPDPRVQESRSKQSRASVHRETEKQEELTLCESACCSCMVIAGIAVFNFLTKQSTEMNGTCPAFGNWFEEQDMCPASSS
jgi:hypothetical protein